LPLCAWFPSAGKWQVSRNGARYAKWRSDSRELLYLADNGDLMSVQVNSSSAFVSATPKRLFTLPAGSRYEILPDGSRILARLPDEAFLSAPITIVLNWQRLLTR